MALINNYFHKFLVSFTFDYYFEYFSLFYYYKELLNILIDANNPILCQKWALENKNFKIGLNICKCLNFLELPMHLLRDCRAKNKYILYSTVFI